MPVRLAKPSTLSFNHMGNKQLLLNLDSIFKGPFLVLKNIGEVSYKLQVQIGSKYHLVFHVSQLKRALPQVPLQVKVNNSYKSSEPTSNNKCFHKTKSTNCAMLGV